jgi:hypothetical protein
MKEVVVKARTRKSAIKKYRQRGTWVVVGAEQSVPGFYHVKVRKRKK